MLLHNAIVLLDALDEVPWVEVVDLVPQLLWLRDFDQLLDQVSERDLLEYPFVDNLELCELEVDIVGVLEQFL